MRNDIKLIFLVLITGNLQPAWAAPKPQPIDIKTAKVGDQIGLMKIVSIEPSGRNQLSPSNAYLKFEGKVTVSGLYVHMVSKVGESESQTTIFKPDPDSV